METPVRPAPDRAGAIALARGHWLHGTQGRHAPPIEPWITRSWQRCLAAGRQPNERVQFDPVSAPRLRQATEASRRLIEAARPVMDRLSRAIAATRYFALLTDAEGTVLDVGALPAQEDRAIADIARVGVDLSERAVGTTAIGATLAEQAPVWLHRGEHFFDDTSVYTCAGAPLFDPQGRCIGMLDLTGVQVEERPELQHLARHAGQAIGNRLLRAQPHALLLQLNWPGCLGPVEGADSDGLLVLDTDGCITGANALARQLLGLQGTGPWPAEEVFAAPAPLLFDAASRGAAPLEVPLWNGLRTQLRATRSGGTGPRAAGRPRLKESQDAWIRQAVDEAQVNVAEAARLLGVSRATVYRKLGRRGG